MGKNKKRNKKNVPATTKQPPMVQLQQFHAPKAVREYWNNKMTPEEREVFRTTIDVARHAGIDQRIGYLLATFYHIHSVQSLIFGQMQNLIENWGLLLKGVQPVINSLQNSSDKFFRTMQGLIKNSQGIQETYYQDVDALYDRVTRWEGIPKKWEPGDEQKLEGMGRMQDILCNMKNGTLKLKEQDMDPEPKEEARLLYAIAEMQDDEQSLIIKQDIAKKGLAAIRVNQLAKKNPTKMYVLYEQRMQIQETCRMTPIKAVQKPEQGELIEIDIKPKTKDMREKGELK